jgi:predicted  nucleic acid-binding Zn-ribbon protein
MWRDGNIMHQIHRDELEKVERERDEARAQLKAMQLEIEAMNQRLREP